MAVRMGASANFIGPVDPSNNNNPVNKPSNTPPQPALETNPFSRDYGTPLLP